MKYLFQTNNKCLFESIKLKIDVFYLKHRTLIMQRQFFRIFPQNPEFVGRFCNKENNLFHFACRR